MPPAVILLLCLAAFSPLAVSASSSSIDGRDLHEGDGLVKANDKGEGDGNLATDVEGTAFSYGAVGEIDVSHSRGDATADEDTAVGWLKVKDESDPSAGDEQDENDGEAVDRDLRGKAKTSKAKSSKDGKNLFGREGACDIEDFVGDRTYQQGDMCEKTFLSTIDCDGGPGNRRLCTYEEVSMDGGSSSYGTCVAFDPAKDLKYDRKRKLCVIGKRRGLVLKKLDDLFCNAELNLKIVKEMESQGVDDSTLLLYFSKDGGRNFYNKDDPRVATKDEDLWARRVQECGCIPDEDQCSSGTVCKDGACIPCGLENQPCCKSPNECLGRNVFCVTGSCLGVPWDTAG
mmetsp:Transcript_6282/g.14202  ORF Transcript_6282/g.14202 Transcript_6282/m.14202 type:complete len:344 (+) Transcript_6282:126-1157(+)